MPPSGPQSANSRYISIAVSALNVPLFLLGIAHALVITEPYWRSHARSGGSLGAIWLVLYSVGPLGFVCSLVLLGAARWIGGPGSPQLSGSAKLVVGLAVAILVFVLATSYG